MFERLSIHFKTSQNQELYRVELGYKATKGTEYFVSLQTGVVLTE
jgi:hypothetical protein